MVNQLASDSDRVFVERLDPYQLCAQSRWPIMRVFAPGFVEQIELNRYMRRLLQSRRGSVLLAVPIESANERDQSHAKGQHLVDLFERRSRAVAARRGR